MILFVALVYMRSCWCRGYAYRKLGRWDKAIEDYTQSLRLSPDNIKTYNNLGYSHAKGGDFESAIRNYSTVRASVLCGGMCCCVSFACGCTGD